MEITFNFSAKLSLANRIQLKKFLKSVAKNENTIIQSLTFVFCSDQYLLKINRDFLNHDYFTDIITFNLSNQPKNTIEGEIYISVDRIKENAKLFNTSIKKELHRVVFHGVLHLCGYKDKTKSQKLIMTSKEDYYLNRYFYQLVPRGTKKKSI